MKYLVLLSLLCISSFAIAMNKISPEKLIEEYTKLSIEEFKKEIDGREKYLIEFAEDKIQEVKKSSPWPYLVAFPIISILSAGCVFSFIYEIFKNKAPYFEDAGLRALSNSLIRQENVMMAIMAIASLVNSGCCLAATIDHFPQNFDKRKNAKLEHYKNFKKEVGKYTTN